MTAMPGNAQCDYAINNMLQTNAQNVSDMKFGAMIQTQATLALAYEQRTANLIAYVVGIDDTSAKIPVVNDIRARLGIEATK